ncbi:hypothetical protein H2202_007589 [Exophiala xenobiotica]|nr:hypothetical protein H2202_007589 [Exophiala xenobiotica]KAK5236406.1 histone H3.3 [Exophiala xenobiotica]KAK5246846.1 histone H3.3 [Exophiala xenobiotica]KAK5323180.1 histone H3.3 [Exophiala xenobiotica]KAK5350517.1 histone H3.3 [Exophiala xenobiotica]
MAPTEQTDWGNDIGDDQPKKSPAEFAATRPGKKILFKKKSSLKKSGRSKYKPESGYMYTGLVIPKLPFQRLVLEILQDHPVSNLLIQCSAAGAMHECAEVYLVSLFEEANLYAEAANRVTVLPRDLHRTLCMRAEAAAVTTDSPSTTSTEPEGLESSERIASVED